MNDTEFLTVAQRINDEAPASPERDELARLIGSTRAASSGTDRAASIDRVYELICRDERGRRRLNELLPTERGIFRGGYEALAGDRQAGDDIFDRMVCPHGDYAWPILDVADPTPSPTVCPNDGASLSFRAAGS